MARAKIIHSQDACTIVFKGNVNNPEPSSGIIKFPGGCVEVTRTSDGKYWIHTERTDNSEIINSILDYKYDKKTKIKNRLQKIHNHENIKKMSLLISETEET